VDTTSNRSLGGIGLAALSLALALIAVLGLQLILPIHDLAGTRGPKSLYVLWAWPIGAAAAAIVVGNRSRRKHPSTRYATLTARLES
jgi:hypothetical protein